ncbi:MAG: NAD(P)H-dependent oxidoreductase [Candidatus Izimaplasma sp.]|nr:NAD(P)H-dependent oxidoreductase [Candidatus Izimaplasma bacterium]
MDRLKIGIILGSTREGRVSPQVGKWLLSKVEKTEVDFEVIDIKEYNLELLGTTDDMISVEAWNQKLGEFDGFIFIVSEYNHSISAALKNALDLAKDAWVDKVAGIVSYGSAGGARAAEHLRNILAELQVATVRGHVLLSLFLDFENFNDFKPRDLHDGNIKEQLSQLIRWGRALKSVRN